MQHRERLLSDVKRQNLSRQLKTEEHEVWVLIETGKCRDEMSVGKIS